MSALLRININNSLKTVNVVQTPPTFSGSVQSSLQPAGFVFSNAFVRSLAVKCILSAAACDCSASVQVWQALSKCIFVWWSIYALPPVVLLHRLAIPHLHDQSSVSVCLFKMPAQGASTPLPLCCIRVYPANAAPLTLCSTGQEPLSPCWQVQLSWRHEQHFREEHANSGHWEDTSAPVLTFTKAGINRNERVCTKILLLTFLFGLSSWAPYLTAWAGLPGGGFYVLYFLSGLVLAGGDLDLGDCGSPLGFQSSCGFFRSKTSPWEFINPYFDWEDIFGWLAGYFCFEELWSLLDVAVWDKTDLLGRSVESIQILAKQKSPP